MAQWCSWMKGTKCIGIHWETERRLEITQPGNFCKSRKGNMPERAMPIVVREQKSPWRTKGF